MATIYPAQIDTNLTLPLVTDNVSPIMADDHNRIRHAIVSVETELGANPSGTKASIKDRFDLLNTSEIILLNTDGYFSATNIEEALSELASGAAVQIGLPEDSTYSDGLFTDFTQSTRIGIAIDRFNEILKELSPPPAPALGDISFTTALGPAGRISFGTSNVIATYSNVGTSGGGSSLDINSSFPSATGTSLRKGIYANNINKAGTLNDSIAIHPSTPTPAYPANAFGDGYLGNLELEVNGIIIHTLDLITFGSGSDLNGNGSGFTSVSAGTPTAFPNGQLLELFYYRIADWLISGADQRNGWNYARIIHNNSPTFIRATNYFEWVVDAVETTTSYASAVLDTLIMAGTNNLSGVTYHTSGTAQYDVTISNLHRNTYSISGSAVSHTTTNCSLPSTSLGTISTEADTEVITNKVVTVVADTANRILNGSIVVSTVVDRTVQAIITSSNQTITGILLDNNGDSSTATNENFSGEDYRIPSNRSLTDTTGFTSGGAGMWDSTISLISATAGYADGCIENNGQIFYPNNSSVTNSGNFSGITNGPAGNVDYTTAAGARVYWRYFYFSSGTNNFTLNLNATGTVVDAGFVTGSTDELSVEFLLPNTTQDEVGAIEFKDANIAFTNIDSIGAYASTYGVNLGSTAGLAWGISFGSRSTSSAGNAVIIRITVGAGWTGSASNIQFTAA